jgi:hypothetical protein
MLERELAFDLESRRSAADGAADLARGARRLLANMGFQAAPEISLPNGRRADLMGLSRKGVLAIVEVKSSLADFRADDKWPEYRDCCDLFYFAVAETFPRHVLPEDAGLIVADAFGAAVLREAPRRELAAGPRRRMTLRFARIVASRLRYIEDPGL